MDQRTTGLILRTRPLTETSLIVQWLTPGFGRLSTVAKGARRAKSPFSGKLDLFYLADFSLHWSRRSPLHTLREVSVRELHKPLRADLEKLRQACYFVQLLEQTTESDTPLPGVFELLRQALHTVSGAPAQAVTIFAFETKLLEVLGHRPDVAHASLSPGGREVMDWLARSEWEGITRLRMSAAQVHELDNFLRSFLTYEFGRICKARPLAVSTSIITDKTPAPR